FLRPKPIASPQTIPTTNRRNIAPGMPFFNRLLNVSYRLPPAVIRLLEDFAEQFLADEEVDIPQVKVKGTNEQLELPELYPAELRWVQVANKTESVACCIKEINRQMTKLFSDTAIPDITFLARKDLGRAVVRQLATKNVRVLHTFNEDESIARRQKLAFYKGAANVKGTTLHSFKGWEARHLVVFVSSIERAEDRALLYTALTRLRRHENGSALTVVCSCKELSTFGQTWPDFVVVP
ncbi:MAG: hypothetical protein WBC44_16590, partial [Planctomycetaceae bacterium]